MTIAAPAATVTTAPTAKTGVKAGQNEAIVNAGTAEGGTMMYAVTTDNTKPTSTEGFSATVPTAEGLTEACTRYVWYYVKADDSHTDSEISATGIEVTIAAPAGIDLSMVDCAGNARASQWTANCYMVHTAGYYYLPLVYGNAIKSGADNTAAYTGVSGSNTTATFPRHDGQAITAPWIKDNGITVASAELLWQDAQGLITAVDIDGDYLTLTVGKNATEQEGNALVAAKDASGNIVWSWHIWVTKQTFATLTAVTVSGYNYQVTPVNLGWVGDATSTTGYHTYYQWGRKDAFIPSTGTGNTNHTVYNISNTTVSGFSYTQDNSATIGTNIQNPTVYNRNSTTNSSCNTQYYNMWDAQKTSDTNAAAATVKTVYDPCPPGFCVPTSGLYNFIASQTRPTFSKGYTYSGVFFPASGYRKDSSSALDYVSSRGYCWSATPGSGTNGRRFYFYVSGWSLGVNTRSSGYPVRAVAE